MTKGSWDAQVKMVVKAAKDRAGRGWSILGDDIREALVAKEVLSILLAQSSESFNPTKALIRETYAAIGVEIGRE